MSPAREIEVHDQLGGFQLRSYWFGEKWCPAVYPDGDGWRIRVGWQTGSGWEYRYFELDAQGVITRSPHGHARDFNGRYRVTNVAALADRLAAVDTGYRAPAPAGGVSHDTSPEDGPRFRL